MAMNSEDIVSQVIKLYEQSSGNRGTWESHWDEIARRMFPLASEYFTSDSTGLSKGNKRNHEIYDSTAMIALSRFGAIMDSLLTPRNQVWHRLQSAIDELNEDRQVQLWFDEVNRTLFKHRYSTNANFASQNQMNFKSLGAFGSASLYIDASEKEPGLRYKNCHLGETYFVENHQGMIDRVIRKFRMTARQIRQKWPNAMPDNVRSALEQDQSREFVILHFVGPNVDINPGMADFQGMPYASYYVCLEGRALMEVGGYNTFPYTPSRYEQAPNEVYGRSPAMDVLPAIKSLNEQKKTMLKQGHRAVDPVLLVHDDGILDTFSLKPGHANAGAVTKDGRPLVHTLPGGSIAAGQEMMDEERKLINDSFLITIFQILAETPTMTATEVLERTREKGILLAPTLGRQQSERLGPQIERELDVLAQQNLLPEMPPVLEEAGANFKVEYDSPLSRAQRAEESAGLMRTLESVLNVVNVTGDPAPLDHFDWDVITPEISDINAVPAKWRKGAKQIQAERQARAEKQQQEDMVNAAPAMAGLQKAQQK